MLTIVLSVVMTLQAIAIFYLMTRVKPICVSCKEREDFNLKCQQIADNVWKSMPEYPPPVNLSTEGNVGDMPPDWKLDFSQSKLKDMPHELVHFKIAQDKLTQGVRE